MDKHTFYGLRLNAEQKTFRDAIYTKGNLITFVNSCAGSGKTLVAVATANLMVELGLAEEIIYITSACHERKQGYLAGSLFEKSREYFYPLYDALYTIGIDPNKVIHGEDSNVEKYCAPYITLMTDTYIRGRNFGNDTRTIVICDECQNLTTADIKTLLSRVCNTSICVVIGHEEQCDLVGRDKSGFAKCIKHYSDRPWATICSLIINYRGLISQWADMLPDD